MGREDGNGSLKLLVPCSLVTTPSSRHTPLSLVPRPLLLPPQPPTTLATPPATRDFTVNALFYNLNHGAVEDLTGKGLADLRAGLLRTPLPASETFLDGAPGIQWGRRRGRGGHASAARADSLNCLHPQLFRLSVLPLVVPLALHNHAHSSRRLSTPPPRESLHPVPS